VFELHTSGGGFSCLDLPLGRIWQHQEVYIFMRSISRPYHLSQVGTISRGRVRFGDSVILGSRRLQARSELETSLKCLWMPDLSSGKVSDNSEAPFS
jgi:hypothetical protein